MSSSTIIAPQPGHQITLIDGGDQEPTRDVVIRVEGVRKHYDGDRIKALDGVSLEVLAGEFLAIVGPSGSGKSTLLHLLGALDTPDTGRVLVDGTDIGVEKDLATFRRHTVGFVFQLHNLIPTLKAWENVQMALLEERMSARERKRRAVDLLKKLGLADRIDSLPPTLSGGERQRVAIARALVCDPHILIADEPTGAVDSANSAAIIELLRQLGRERGMTVVVVTHDPDVAAQADRRVHILDGKLVT